MAVIGGAGVPALPQITINKSQTWVPPQDGNVCIHVVGAGGSGAIAVVYYDAAGAAGAYAKIPTLAVTTAGSFTLVVGMGGAFRTASAEADGYAGGNSTIAGTGITGTLTCGGGGGGLYNVSAGNRAAGGAVSGSTNEGWAGYSGGGGRVSGGAVGIFATGNESSTSASGSLAVRGGAATDAAFGGLAMSGHGAICGGTSGGRYVQNILTDNNDGDDFCGGGYGYATGSSGSTGGKGGVGAGGGAFFPTGYNHVKGRSGAGGNGIILIQYLS